LEAEKPRIIGTPILLSCLPTYTFEELHITVWDSIKRYVIFPDLPPLVEGHAWEVVKDKLPYTLKYVNRNGTLCGICNWNRNCRGCDIELSDQIITLKDRQTIAVHWDPTKLQEYFSMNKTRELTLHPTMQFLLEKEREPIDIFTCIQEFTSSERLSGEELWRCSACSEYQPSVKSIALWRLPPVVILHLKRFQQLKKGLFKIHRLVSFPFIFDFAPCLPPDQSQSTIYHLHACLNHLGNLGSGHYTSFAKNQMDSKWYCYDDGRCSLVEDPTSTIISPTAYVLFYVREGYTGIDFTKIKDLLPSTKNEPACLVM